MSKNHEFGAWLEMTDLLIIITWHTIISCHARDAGRKWLRGMKETGSL